jgi:methylated-DNA-[protein]-cysteine S-methyltransferase
MVFCHATHDVLGMSETNHYAVFETASGFCNIAWNGIGIVGFQLPTRRAEAAEHALRRRVPGVERAAPPTEVLGVIAAAQRYFAGEKVDFSGVQVDLTRQEDFFRRIYAALRRVGYGQTTTYGALAKELGAGPEAARDVGQAMATNPVPLIIPCHRVLAADGKLGGFSAPGARPNRRSGRSGSRTSCVASWQRRYARRPAPARGEKSLRRSDSMWLG